MNEDVSIYVPTYNYYYLCSAPYNVPYTINIQASDTYMYENFTFACDDAAAGTRPSFPLCLTLTPCASELPVGPISANTDFNVTFKTYTGLAGTLCAAVLSDGTIAAYQRVSVVGMRINASHADTAKVNEPISVTLQLLDEPGNVIPNPDEYSEDVVCQRISALTHAKSHLHLPSHTLTLRHSHVILTITVCPALSHAYSCTLRLLTYSLPAVHPRPPLGRAGRLRSAVRRL